MASLFDQIPESAMTPEQRKALYAKVPRKRGHFRQPGSGPQCETCGTCAHYRTVGHHGKTYRKCALVKETRGAGTDIRKKDPACSGWTRRPS